MASKAMPERGDSNPAERHPVVLPRLLEESEHANRIKRVLREEFNVCTLSLLQYQALQSVGTGSVIVHGPTGAGKSLVSELAVA